MNIKTNNDTPITTKEEDRLGRTNFVDNLYNLITNSEDILKENSLTIDINGKWGDGKTSVINLLKKKFKDDNDNKYKFIDFNAWKISKNKENVNDELYLEIIDKVKFSTNKNDFDLLFIKICRFISEKHQYLFYFAFILLIFYLFYICFCTKTEPTDLFEKIFQLFLSIFCAIWGFLKYYYHIIGKKEILKSLLEKIKDKKYIVVIDDIDRLGKDQICNLISFVKSNLDLPKFIFIFLYDREIINKILSREYKDPKFLEKIVNCQLDLPQIRQEYLEKFLEEEIKEIFELQDDNNKHYYYNLKKELYPHYFTNMRKVKRFLNQLNTDYRMLIDVDIDNIDFLFIEIIKHFEYKLYEFIRDNKEKFIGYSIEYDPTNKEKMKELQKKIQQNTKNNKIIDTMENIFPQISINKTTIKDYQYSNRISSNQSFYKYFQLDNNIEEITKSEYNDLKQSFDNIDNFIDNLEKLADQKINNAKTLNKDINLGNVVYSFKQCFLDDVDFFAYGVNFVYDTTNKELLIKIYCILMICDIYGNKNHNDFYLENYNEIFKILNKEKYLIYITHSLEYYLSILKSTMEDNICIQNYVDNLPKFIDNIFKYFIDIDFNYKKNDYKYINSLEKLLSNLFYFKDLNNLLLKQGIIENIVKIFNKFKEFIHRNEINKNVVRILIKLLINCVKSNQTIKNDLFYIIKYNTTLFEESEIKIELRDNNLLEEFNNYNIN